MKRLLFLAFSITMLLVGFQDCYAQPRGNAIQLQGRNLSANSPTDTNVICWTAAMNHWGPCAATVGSGTVTTVTGSGPAWLTWTISNPTTAPAISLAATTGQSSHQVIGTCGSATIFGPCALVAADLPATTVFSSINTVSFAATPVFDLSLGTVQTITLTGNVTNSTFTNGVAGGAYTFIICQDGSGNHTYVFGAAWHAPMTIGSTASLCSMQQFIALNATTLYGSVGLVNQ